MWHRTVTVSILVLLTLLACPVAVAAQPVLGDINGDGAVDATDVQLVINAALGIAIGGPVPDVVDLTRAAAETAITSAGFLVGTVTEANSDTVPTGNVISQIPAGGSLAVTGAAISLTVSLGPSGQNATLLLPGNVPLELVWIPAGTFMMGRYPGEQDSYDWEDPQHQVTLTQGFWLGKYEVTKAQWTAVMGTTPWSGQSYVLNDPNSPAVYVSWNDAQAFITAVNALGQGTVRLPTEAQWEYACRAGTTTRFYWGDDPSYTAINGYAWWYGNAWGAGEAYAHIVGLKLPNAWGLYDMSGNVWEWCQDWYGGYPSASVTDPTGPSSGSNRVLRGGGWFNLGFSCRSAYRDAVYPGDASSGVGFRLAR